ncbi:MAG: DUF1501 domain-containing protein [Flavobacteriales bacterium]|nr:DUF1501 domain-containing protein [Flavobacteriales bacterium]MCB9166257.1 DUF1501 domain-containing protein [Flavobacteriales bacterium]
MNRRDFLRSTTLATVGGMAVRGMSSPLMAALANSTVEDRVLVVVQLFGGNDGLNTVIPLDQYSLLSGFRSQVIIPDTDVLLLSGTGNATGLHPAMSGLMDLWNDDKLTIVQGVGYPDPNYSHFRATDIWETGSGSDTVLSSGWGGRYLNLEYPNYPVGFPNAQMPDPLAIRIGGPVSVGLQHMGVNMGIAINNTNDPLNLAGNIYLDPVSADCSGGKLDFVRTVQRQADLYGDVIEAAAQLGCNQSTLYPVGNQPGAELAQALKIVAQLICGGLKTKIYWVSMTGFDTHAQQVDSGDHTTGVHATLLQGLSDAIRAFQDDLYLLGLEDRVLGMTFSEFGRRIMSNASGGTDHGSSEPMFLFGTKVLPGMLGSNPVIDPGTTFNTNLAMQYDYRSVYASVLKDWFCLDQAEVDQVLLSTYQSLALVDPDDCIAASVHEANQGAGESIIEVLPNPFVEHTVIRYSSHGGRVVLQVFDEQGHLVRTLVNDDRPPGGHQVGCDLGDMPTGIYYCRLQNNGRQQVKNMLKVR